MTTTLPTTTVPDTDTDTDPPGARSRLRSGTRILVHRWPTVLAVTFSALTWGGGASGYAVILPLLPALYAAMVAIGRRWLTWPVLIASTAGVLLLRAQHLVDPRTVVLVVAAAALGVAVVHGRGGREVLVQGAGVVVFGGLALLSAIVVPGLAVWLVAAGWFGHGLWDAWHLYRDRVVSRSFAEWCGVVDVLVAVELVLGAASWGA